MQWVKPELIAEVAFGDWTSGGHIRHAVFQGLRTDKPAREITRERAAAVTRAPTAKAQAKPAGKIGKLTHPERVIDPSTGLTKLDLARYYGLVAPLLLEHLNSRPVSFLRAPAGIQGELFFQKHLEAAMPGVKSLPPKLDPGHPPLLEVPTAEAVLSAVQMNVVEFHTWNAVKTAIGKPDRMLFDLDPGEGVGWPAVQQAAQLVRTLLDEIGLTPWLKTSGGKGLHVVVPLRRQYDWGTIKAFSQAIVTHLARTLPKQFVAKRRAEEPGRQDLRRLSAQRLRRHHGGGLVRPGAAGAGRVGAGGVGRVGEAAQRRTLDDRKHSFKAGRGQHSLGGVFASGHWQSHGGDRLQARKVKAFGNVDPICAILYAALQADRERDPQR